MLVLKKCVAFLRGVVDWIPMVPTLIFLGMIALFGGLPSGKEDYYDDGGF